MHARDDYIPTTELSYPFIMRLICVPLSKKNEANLWIEYRPLLAMLFAKVKLGMRTIRKRLNHFEFL
jgi:hypothetical protein